MDLQLSSNDELVSGKKVSILEVAAFLTDSEMNVLSRFSTPILESGSHPGIVRIETDPALRNGYDEAGLWDAMDDGMGLAAADIYLQSSLSTAMEDFNIPRDAIFTVICRRAYLTSQIIKRDMKSLTSRIAYDFIDVDTVKTFFETFMPHLLTAQDIDFLFRKNTYNSELNVTANMESISLILTKLPGKGVPELIAKKGRRSL